MLDTSVLVSFFADPEKEPERHRECIELLRRAHTFHVATVAMPEVLGHFPVVKRRDVGRRLSSTFFIEPFDVGVVDVASALHAQALRIYKAQKAPRQGRQCVKLDCYILATALAKRMDAVCSFDGDYGPLLDWARAQGCAPQTFRCLEPAALVPDPPLPLREAGQFAALAEDLEAEAD
ncbi:MAG: type II toxin-antitoxin system VapC family toxin [bacterium]